MPTSSPLFTVECFSVENSPDELSPDAAGTQVVFTDQSFYSDPRDTPAGRKRG